MSMNPLDFLNSFLSNAKYGAKGTVDTLRDNYQEAFPLKYEQRTWEKSNNPIVQQYAMSPTYGREQSRRMAMQEPAQLPNSIVQTRSSSDYSNWLKSSENFDLGGRRYKWVEAPINGVPSQLASLPQTSSRGYNTALSTLIDQKRALTGNSRYIPVALT